MARSWDEGTIRELLTLMTEDVSMMHGGTDANVGVLVEVSIGSRGPLCREGDDIETD